MSIRQAWPARLHDLSRKAVDPIDALIEAPPPPRSGDDWYSFVGTVRAIHSGSLGWPSELERVRLWYERQLERIHGISSHGVPTSSNLSKLRAAIRRVNASSPNSRSIRFKLRVDRQGCHFSMRII
jgi:hypothetical protein